MSVETLGAQREQSWASSLSAFGLVGFFAMTPAAAAAGGLALAPLFGLAALVAAPGTRAWRLMQRSWPLWLCLALFCGWAAASMAWSPFQPGALDTWQALQLALLFLAGLLFVGACDQVRGLNADLARGAVIGCVLVLAGLLLIEAFGDMPLNRMGQPDGETGALLRNPGRGAAALCVLGLAAMGLLLGFGGLKRALSRVVIIATGACAFQFGMDINVVAFVVGVIAAFVAFQAPRIALTALGVGLAIWVASAPFVTEYGAHLLESVQDQMPLSWQMRLVIWDHVNGEIRQSLLLGHGLDASRTVEGLGRIGDHTFPILPLHPHNAALQIWYELGAIGAGLVALAAVFGFAAAGRALAKERAAAAAAAGSFAALAVLWSASYGAWQEWLIVLSFAAAGVSLMGRDLEATGESRN